MSTHLPPVNNDRPGGPSATPIHLFRRAGSPNHQEHRMSPTDASDHLAAPDKTTEQETTVTPTSPAGSTPAATSTSVTSEELYERWRELGHAGVELLASGVLIALAVVLANHGVLAGLLDLYGDWGWFTGGVAAAMLLDLAATALGRLSRAFWLLWLTYRPAPAWASVAVLMAGGERR